MKILLLEDDVRTALRTSRFLATRLHQATIAADRQTGLKLVRSERYDLIIADWNLPDGTGLDFVKEIRSFGMTTPVIITTVLGDTSEKVLGLDAGADDYLVKPFSPEELHARIDAVSRRADAHETDTVISAAGLKLDRNNLIVERDGIRIPVRKGESDLLAYFMQNAGRLLSPEKIIRDVWKFAYLPGTCVVETRVSALRKKLNSLGSPDLIRNRRNAGYIFGRPDPT